MAILAIGWWLYVINVTLRLCDFSQSVFNTVLHPKLLLLGAHLEACSVYFCCERKTNELVKGKKINNIYCCCSSKLWTIPLDLTPYIYFCAGTNKLLTWRLVHSWRMELIFLPSDLFQHGFLYDSKDPLFHKLCKWRLLTAWVSHLIAFHLE